MRIRVNSEGEVTVQGNHGDFEFDVSYGQLVAPYAYGTSVERKADGCLYTQPHSPDTISGGVSWKFSQMKPGLYLVSGYHDNCYFRVLSDGESVVIYSDPASITEEEDD